MQPLDLGSVTCMQLHRRIMGTTDTAILSRSTLIGETDVAFVRIDYRSVFNG